MELLLMWLLSVLFRFSSDGSVDHAEASDSAEPGPAAEPAVSPVQLQFEQREELPSCGSFVAGPSGLVSAEVRPGWQCLEDSVDGAGGEMVAYDERGEGIPVYTYVRVNPQGLMELCTQDLSDFANAWSYDICSVQQESFRQGCP